ncbi:MAG: thermonuclease family protein [Parvularculaceae bacterium]
MAADGLTRRALALGLALAPFRASGAPEVLSGREATVDGRRILLADILTPTEGPYAKKSSDALAAALVEPVDVAPLSTDRWGRTLARATRRRDGASIAQLILAAGLARVRPETDDRVEIGAYLRVEAAARGAGRGLWGSPDHRVFNANAGYAPVGAFALVAGEIRSAAARRSRLYLNFGEDYRTDVTASAMARAARRWPEFEYAAEAGASREAWAAAVSGFAGRRIRVRGYVAWINGPSIDLTHPDQAQWLD